MEEVAANSNWRFILTTREYILNIAKRQHEVFAQPSVDLTMCVINLSDYTRPIRAKILYNHIYFSDLPRDYKLALLEDRGYEEILSHRNYNPRVIEYMTQSRHACTVAPTLYLREFVDSLNNPKRIWDHVFRHQISEAARHLLLVMTTLREDARLEDIEKSFWKFYTFRAKHFGFPTSPGDWTDALKELDGNFIKSGKVGKDLVVSFHNPSVRDFMEQFLANSDVDAVNLLMAVHFYEQYTSLWAGIRGKCYRGIKLAGPLFLRELAANIWGPSARTIRTVNQRGETLGLSPHPPSNENRAEFLIRVADELAIPNCALLIEQVLSSLSSLWEAGTADREDLVRLLEFLTKRGLKQSEASFVAARRCVLMAQETNDDFRAAANFYEKYPETLSADEHDTLKARFLAFASDHPSRWDDDPDWLHQVAADIEYVGKKLDVDTEEYTQALIERAEEIEKERAEQEPPEDDERRWEPSDSRVEDVQGMFESLASDLRNQ